MILLTLHSSVLWVISSSICFAEKSDLSPATEVSPYVRTSGAEHDQRMSTCRLCFGAMLAACSSCSIHCSSSFEEAIRLSALGLVLVIVALDTWSDRFSEERSRSRNIDPARSTRNTCF
jgi:hypothetical protein